MPSIPEWMPQPKAPPPDSPYEGGAKIIDQRLDSDGTVLVTWALPGFATAIVRMPYSEWVQGWAHLHAPTLVKLAQAGDIDYEPGEPSDQQRDQHPHHHIEGHEGQ